MSRSTINIQEELEALQQLMSQNEDRFNPNDVADFDIDDTSPTISSRRDSYGFFKPKGKRVHFDEYKDTAGGCTEHDGMVDALENISSLGMEMGSIFKNPPRSILSAKRHRSGQEEDIMTAETSATSSFKADEARESKESRRKSKQKYEDEINAFANRTRGDFVGKQPSWMKKEDDEKKEKIIEPKPLAFNKRGILHLAGKKTNSKPFVLGQPDDESPRVSKQQAAELIKKHEISEALEKKKADVAEHTSMGIDNEISKETDKKLVENTGLQSDVVTYGPVVPYIEKTVAIIDGFGRESDCPDIRRVLFRIGHISNFKCTKTCTGLFAEVTFSDIRDLDFAIQRSPIKINHAGTRIFVMAKNEYTAKVNLLKGARVSVWTADGRVAESTIPSYNADGSYSGPCQID